MIRDLPGRTVFWFGSGRHGRASAANRTPQAAASTKTSDFTDAQAASRYRGDPLALQHVEVHVDAKGRLVVEPGKPPAVP